MLDGFLCSSSVELVRYEDHLAWAAEPLCMRYAFRVDNKRITTTQAIKLHEKTNIFTAIVRRKTVLSTTYRVFSTMRDRLRKTTR